MDETAFGLRLLRRVGDGLTRLRRSLGWGIALVWMAGIAALSSIPASSLQGLPFGGFVSNLEHAFLFGMLALWMSLGMPRRDGRPYLDARALSVVFLLVLAYGIFDEWHQSSTPGRHASGYDVLTDAVGAACTLMVARYVPRAEADGRGLALRLGFSVLFCCLAAALATWGPVPA